MKHNVNEITKDDFQQALEAVWNGEVATIAPLGFSVDNVYLYNNPTPDDEGEGYISWSGCVVLGSWSNIPSLLIGNKLGQWLVELKIGKVMGFDHILEEFFGAFEKVKHLIDRYDKYEYPVKISDDVKFTTGFDILEQQKK